MSTVIATSLLSSAPTASRGNKALRPPAPPHAPRCPRWHILLLLLMMAANFSLKAWLDAEPHFFDADESYHALVAKNLVAHPLTPTLYDDPALPVDFHDWSRAHIWVHKPPMTTYLMAFSLAVFGLSEFAARFPDLLLSTAAIALTYLMGRRLFNPRTALLAAGLHAAMGILILLSAGTIATDHVDSFFVAFTTLAMYFAVREATDENPSGWLLVLLGIAVGLDLLTKWLPALIVLPVWAALMPPRPWRIIFRKIAMVAAVALAVAGPWFLYIRYRFPAESAWERAYNFLHLTTQLENQHRPWSFFLTDLAQLYSYLAYIPLAWLLFYAAAHPRHRPARALAIWILLVYIFFSISAMRMQCYVLLAAPAILLTEAWWCDRLLTRAADATYFFRWLRIASVAALLLLTLAESAFMTIPALRRPRWYWVDAHKASDLAIAAELRALPQTLAAVGIPTHSAVLFNVEHPIEAMFYTDFTAYDTLPTPAQISAITAAQRPIVIAAPPGWTPPAILLDDPRVHLLRTHTPGL